MLLCFLDDYYYCGSVIVISDCFILLVLEVELIITSAKFGNARKPYYPKFGVFASKAQRFTTEDTEFHGVLRLGFTTDYID
jgi:hypothetical protein